MRTREEPELLNRAAAGDTGFVEKKCIYLGDLVIFVCT